MRRPVPALLAATAVAAALTGCSSTATPSAAPVAEPVAASTPLAAPAVVPRAGQVLQEAGPFDDRFALTGLAVADGAVTGALRVTSDVSQLVVLEVAASFYDAAGTLLGTEVQVHEDDHGSGEVHTGEEVVEVEVPAGGAYAARAVAATVRVPVLVNE